MTYPTEATAVAALLANGFKPAKTEGYYSKPSMTGGNLMEGPRKCIALCTVKHHKVDAIWNSPDYFTVEFI